MDVDAIRTWSRRQLGKAAGGLAAATLGSRLGEQAAATANSETSPEITTGWQQATPVATTRPDIVVIVLDDMRWSDYSVMPLTQSLVGDEGITFPNYIVTSPTCAPSRASFYRGQYAHNHGVGYGAGGSIWSLFHDTGLDQDTVAVWLHDAGYRTALVGKHMNQLKGISQPGPGWDDWVVPRKLKPFNYELSVNGAEEVHKDADEDYLTDVLAGKASEFIASTPEETPLFLYFAPKAPHKPVVPAPRHAGMFADAHLDQSGSFNEADMSDKPINMQRSPLTPEEIAMLNTLNQGRLESLQAADEAVAQIIETLDAAGRLENAYVFFTSDNGYALGEHRDEGKSTPYEEAIRVGMMARGPHIPAGQINQALVANIDLAPTFAEIAGATTPDFVDGRSILGALQGGESGRQALLIEIDSSVGQDDEDDEDAVVVDEKGHRIAGRVRSSWRGIRTADWTYVEWGVPAIDFELYDLHADPAQLQSLYADPAYADTVEELAGWLATLVDCAADTCRQAENAPPS